MILLVYLIRYIVYLMNLIINHVFCINHKLFITELCCASFLIDGNDGFVCTIVGYRLDRIRC